MRAAQCTGYGGPEQVTVTDVADPQLGPNDVRVAIEVAAVNFPDVLIVAGDYQVKVPPPFVPGSEFAGTVVEVGSAVLSRLVGDRVFGSGMVGAFAEQIVVPASSVSEVPVGVSTATAAGFGVAHRTAYHSLRTVASLQAGDDLLVLGAGGGVGLAAVQLGALMGATVTAVASTAEKLTAAKECGASTLINHREDDDFRTALRERLPGGADVVIDPVGGDLSEPALRGMRYGGRFVTVGYASGAIPRMPLNLVLLKGVEILGFEFRSFAMHRPEEDARDEAELMELLASGKVAPYVGARFDLDHVADALRHVAEGKAIGKVLLDVS
jgi:NADPH2:quinone reductase